MRRVVTLPVFYDNLWIENRVGIKRDRIDAGIKNGKREEKKMKYEIKGGELPSMCLWTQEKR